MGSEESIAAALVEEELGQQHQQHASCVTLLGAALGGPLGEPEAEEAESLR